MTHPDTRTEPRTCAVGDHHNTPEAVTRLLNKLLVDHQNGEGDFSKFYALWRYHSHNLTDAQMENIRAILDSYI